MSAPGLSLFSVASMFVVQWNQAKSGSWIARAQMELGEVLSLSSKCGDAAVLIHATWAMYATWAYSQADRRPDRTLSTPICARPNTSMAVAQGSGDSNPKGSTAGPSSAQAAPTWSAAGHALGSSADLVAASNKRGKRRKTTDDDG